MIVFYRKIYKPIFEEKLGSFSGNGLHQAGYMILVVYQLHQSTAFGHSIFNKVKSTYYNGESTFEIPRNRWTDEMRSHAQMRENTVTRAPKSIRYTAFGKAFFVFALIVFITAGILAVKSISGRKNELKQEAALSVPPRQGDVYYGYFIQNGAPGKGATKMFWTWLRVDQIEGKTFLVSVNRAKTERPMSGDGPTEDFDLPLRATYTPGAIPGFKSADNSFNFFAKRKQ